MELPAITIPFDLPFDLPVLLHPVAVHFAVVLPIIVLILELANLAFKRRSLSVVSLGILLLTVGVYLGAYFTGKTDGSEAFDLLGEEAQGELKAHKMLGIYLVYALLLPLAFKLTAMLLRQKWAKSAMIVTMILFISFVFKQGHDGGELVYEYGVNVAAVAHAEERIDDMVSEMEELNATLASTKADAAKRIAELNASVAECYRNGVVNENYMRRVPEAPLPAKTPAPAKAAAPAETKSSAGSSRSAETNGSVETNSSGKALKL